MAFQQGLSGLNTSSSQLDAIGNNIANASTVGFKSQTAQFSDIFASAFNGGGAPQVGIGASLAGITENFSQGSIQTSNNSLDMAVNGQGFFRMANTTGSVSYSRDGQFQLDKNGYLINAQGLQLTGYAASATGTIVAATPTALQIPTANLNPIQSANAVVGVNLDSTSTIPATTPFNPTDPTSFNNSTSLTLYDSLGNSHVATMYFALAGAPAVGSASATAGASNIWNTYMTLDGNKVPAAGTPIGTLGFNSSGAMVYPTAVAPLKLGQLSVPIALTNGATSPQTVTMDFSTSTQYGSPFGVNQITQDGYASGQLTGFNTSATGIIQGLYSNGQSKNLGQIVLANFGNSQGLQNLGNNQWSQSNASGTALIGVPGTGSLGAVQSGATEASNVNLTNQLVEMITAQQNYQANAQTIKTENQITQTLVNLK